MIVYGGFDMKEMDRVEVTVEKEKYFKYGVHKGMQGWICDERCIDECRRVNFPQCGEKEDIAEIPIKEKDLKLIDIMDAKMNEEIAEKYK